MSRYNSKTGGFDVIGVTDLDGPWYQRYRHPFNFTPKTLSVAIHLELH